MLIFSAATRLKNLERKKKKSVLCIFIFFVAAVVVVVPILCGCMLFFITRRLHFEMKIEIKNDKRAYSQEKEPLNKKKI